jgi:hypothetical protein
MEINCQLNHNRRSTRLRVATAIAILALNQRASRYNHGAQRSDWRF